MNFLISPTAFKGTLTPFQGARVLTSAAQSVFPKAHIDSLPLADGGDGTLDVLLNRLSGRVFWTSVKGPLGKAVRARWGFVSRLPGFTAPVAVIEMAEASGLRLLHGKNKIRDASTFGTGQLMRAALEAGCRTLLIGVGGTATADGGAGALAALGLRYLDRQNRSLRPVPSALISLDRVDRSHLDRRLEKTSIFVLCDVTNPLLGRRGSARVFGPQKGASPSDVRFLESFLKRWSRFARISAQDRPGAGAAGAMAFGLSGFLGARLVEGGTFILNAVGWEKSARRADVILTGEGALDETSFSGKVIGAITRKRRQAKIIVVCGFNKLPKRAWKKRGIWTVEEMGLRGLKDPAGELGRAAERALRKIYDDNNPHD